MSSSLISPLTNPSNPALPAPASSSSTAASLTSSAPTESEFLQLLVAELKNQSPDNTADPTQFVTELAQFATLGEETQSAGDLDAIKAAFTAASAPSTSAPAAGSAASGASPANGTSSTTGTSSS